MRADLPSVVFLFEGGVVKGSVLNYGAAQGKAGAEAPK